MILRGLEVAVIKRFRGCSDDKGVGGCSDDKGVGGCVDYKRLMGPACRDRDQLAVRPLPANLEVAWSMS